VRLGALVALATAALIGGGCSKKPGNGNGPDSGVGFDAGLPYIPPSCLAKTDVPTSASLLAVLGTATGSPFEVKLSPDGCWRLRGSSTATTAHDEVIRLTGGYTVDLDAGFALVPEVKVRLATNSDATGWRYAFDGDEDGFAEWRQTELYDGGVWSARTDSQYNPSSQALIAQTLITNSGDGGIYVVVSAIVNGVLSPVQSYDAPGLQATCYSQDGGGGGPDGGCTESPPGPCSPSQTAALTAAFTSMSSTALTCFQNQWADVLSDATARLAAAFNTPAPCPLCIGPKVTFQCFTSTCNHAYESEPDGQGNITITVNGGDINTSLIQKILFHETAHAFLPPHNDAMIAANPLLAPWVDQVYACSRYCFANQTGGGLPANQCDCARCLGTTTCSLACASLPACNNPALGRSYPQTATDTASWCASSQTLCDTQGECNASGGGGGACSGGCQSFSLSCNPTCQ
jgi:hypothetical protein